MAKNPRKFLTRANQNFQEINRHFYATLNIVGTMVFAENQRQNESYTFKDVLFQTDKSYFNKAIIKEVEENEAGNYWTFIKNS